MACELEPLSWKKFEEYHRIAWENGWTYGPAHTELYLEYLKNWEYFIEYIQNLTNNLSNQNNCIKILIGEAPPFWAGNSEQEDRSYFYNEKQTRGSTWLNAPFKYFHYLKHPNLSPDNQIVFDESKKSLTFGKENISVKSSRLDFLAEEGVILLDIFPFPIRQATKIRETVTADFSVHLDEYFCDFYNKVKSYIICKAKTKTNVQFKYALVTPIFTGLQILYGSKSKLVFEEIVSGDLPMDIVDFSSAPGKNFTIQTYCKQCFKKKNSFRNFFGKIAFDDGEWLEDDLNPFNEDCEHSLTPILIDTSGNVNFSNFFNSDVTKLKVKINDSEMDEEDSE
jgi:hypothetical protein